MGKSFVAGVTPAMVATKVLSFPGAVFSANSVLVIETMDVIRERVGAKATSGSCCHSRYSPGRSRSGNKSSPKIGCASQAETKGTSKETSQDKGGNSGV